MNTRTAKRPRPLNDDGAIEAVLFVHADPLPVAAIAELLECSEEETLRAIRRLAARYEEDAGRGLRLTVHEGMAQIVTHPRASAAVERLREHSAREALTPAALETLAVIAYRGPIAKTEIEVIRGVNCSFVLRTLLLRGLVDRERNSNDNRSYLYRITPEFLHTIGVAASDELPSFETFAAQTSHDAPDAL